MLSKSKDFLDVSYIEFLISKSFWENFVWFLVNQTYYDIKI